jgi:hypothetical protein
MCFYTINDIKRANHRLGHHWFEADTLRFFRSRILPGVIAGGFFITSENDCLGTGRRYTVRLCREDGSIETVGQFQQFSRADSARRAVVRLVRGTFAEHIDAVREGKASPDTLKLV